MMNKPLYTQELIDLKNHALTSLSAVADTITLSGRPQFTNINIDCVYNGVSSKRELWGYSLDTVFNFVISADNNIFNLPLTTYNMYESLCGNSALCTPSQNLSSYYPEITGYLLSTFKAINYNIITVNLPAPTANGTFDLIAINPAGYGVFSQDVSATGLLSSVAFN